MRYLVVLSLTSICSVITSCQSAVPDRADGIPANAFWVGGVDGGNWFIVDSIDRSAQSIYCEIYNDNNGELIQAKKISLHCYHPDKEINWNNLQNEFEGFDGEYLILKTRDTDNKYCYFK